MTYGGFQNPFYPGAQVLPGMQNYMMPQTQQAPQQPQMQVVRVNGRNGAEAYAIGPNSSSLLLDESGTLVWLVTTDGAGYKTISPYDITPHQAAPAPDYTNLETRIARLEGIMNELSGDSSATRRGEPTTSGHQKHDGNG